MSRPVRRSQPADWSGLEHALETRVHPRTVELQSTDALSWLNYSSKRARISFDSDVAKKMTCKATGSFRIDGDRLTTGDIQATQFASVCSLAPGEYEYRVDLRHGAGSSGGGTEKSLRGRIVVSD